MTISAQVIDTIVEWIDDNLHQPLRIEEIARHACIAKKRFTVRERSKRRQQSAISV